MRKRFKRTQILLLLCIWILSAAQVIAQNIQVTGKITDQTTGEALPGVTITLKGSTQGFISDINGLYQISIPKGSTLVYSFVGYLPQEIIVETTQTLNVALVANVEKLDEVVVIGYGQVKKKDATGSLSAVGSKDFNKGAITSPQELLMGKASGVIITPGDGAPGSGSTIRIRGGASLNANNDPLIVIDGVPVDKGTVSGLANPLLTINPNDIESFTILKDASATAIYGSRASNGVIIITTKKGVAGPLKISYNGSFSMFTIPGMMDVLSADEYRSIVNEKFPTGVSLLGTANTDWQDEIYKTAFGHDQNLSLSGSVYKIPYRASLGYTNQDGILKTSNIQRTTLSLAINPSLLDDHLHLDINAKGFYNKSNFANTGAIGAAVQIDPTQPVKNGGAYQDGYFGWMTGTTLNDQSVDNPVAMLNLSTDEADVYRSIGNLQADYKFHFLPDLRANMNLAYDYSETKGNKYIPDSTSWTSNFAGNIGNYTQTKKMSMLDFYLNYTKELNPNNKFDVTAGYSWQHFWVKNSDFLASEDEETLINNTYSKTQNYLVSFFGRLNYSFMDRYLMTFTLRNDGSSRFAKDNQWGLFPAVALAWKIKNESFLKNINALSDLKLRLGYGVTGQQELSSDASHSVATDFPYLAIYTGSSNDNTAQYQLGNTFYNTLRPEAYDENIKWESTATYNAGFDFGFLNNKFTGSIDYYFRKTTDLLNKIPVAAGSNLNNEIYTNIGNMENEGIEFTLNANLITKTDFQWTVGYNISFNHNKITKLTMADIATFKGNATGDISGAVGRKIQMQSVGYPINSFYVFKQVYDSNGDPIEGLYADLNGDKVIDDNDLYHYKKPAADVLMGISSRVTYKKWDFSFAGRISLGNYVYNNIASNRGFYRDIYNSGNNFLSNVVKQVNDTKFYEPQYRSDYYIENGSFFRMDNIRLGYRIVIDQKYNLNINMTVQNVFVITKYKGLDPEVFNGIDNNLYPRPRTFILGLNIDI